MKKVIILVMVLMLIPLASATDYEIGDEGLVFTQVFENGNPVIDGFCSVQIFFPNLTMFDSFELPFVTGSRGIYAQNFTIPSTTGVYIIDSDCARPVNSTSQNHFFSEGPPFNLIFKNSTQTQPSNITFFELSTSDGLICSQVRFGEQEDDFMDGEFESIRFLDNITGFSVFFLNDNPTNEITILFKFFRRDPQGDIFLGGTGVQDITLTNSITQIDFPDLQVNFPFGPQSLLETEICIRKTQGADGDIFLLYNSTTENSNFTATSRTLNATVRFDVGGSSELNVKRFLTDISGIEGNIINNISAHNQSIHNVSNEILLQQNVTQNLIIDIVLNFTTSGSQFLQEIAEATWTLFSPRNITNASFVTNVLNVTNVQNATVTNISGSVLDEIGRAVWDFFWRAGSVL